MKRLLFCAGCVLVSGCYDDDPTQSSDIATADMAVYLQLTGDASSFLVDVSFTGPGGDVIFDGGDTPLLLSHGEQQPPAHGGDGLRFEVAPTDSLAVKLERSPPWENGTVAVTLPAVPSLEAPPAWVRSKPYLITWHAENEHSYTVQVSLAGECITPVVLPVAAGTGKLVVYPVDVEASTESCDVTIQLSRSTLANIGGTAFQNASATVQLAYTATVASSP